MQIVSNEFLDLVIKIGGATAVITGAYKLITPVLMKWISKKIDESFRKGNTIIQIMDIIESNRDALDLIKKEVLPNGGHGGIDQIKTKLNNIQRSINIQDSKMECFNELSPNAVFENDENGNCISANQALVDIFGAEKKEDILGSGWVNFIVDGEKQQKGMNWARGILHDKYIKDDYHIIHGKTKTIKHLEYTATIKRNNDGKIITIMGTVKELNN